MSSNYVTSTLSHFLRWHHWKDAVRLAESQINLMQDGKTHFDTISTRIYSGIDYKRFRSREFFEDKVSSCLFYALENQFYVHEIPKPKSPDINVRNYRFLTYPTRLTHYAIGIYLLHITKDFRNNYYNRVSGLKSYYGGDIDISDNGRLNSAERENIYFWSYYKEFTKLVRNLFLDNHPNRILINVDVSNYFDNVDVSNLLESIHKYNKNNLNLKYNFDHDTINLISEFYEWISCNRGGIPQTDNNIISSFIGDLNLKLADLHIDDILKNNKYLDSYGLIRYVDDTYIYLDFQKAIGDYEREKISYQITQNISESLYNHMGLRMNSKSRIYRPNLPDEKQDLIADLFATSLTEDKAESVLSLFPDKEHLDEDRFSYLENYPVGTAKNIIDVISNLHYKRHNLSPDFERVSDTEMGTLKMIYDDNVSDVLKSKKLSMKLRESLKNIDFDLVHVSKGQIISLINRFDDIKSELENHFVSKNNLSLRDQWTCKDYLISNNLPDGKLKSRLTTESVFKDLFERLSNSNKHQKTGYFGVNIQNLQRIQNTKYVVNQIKYRRINETNGRIGPSLNHLLNEIHSICFYFNNNFDKIKNFKSQELISFLQSIGTNHQTILGIRSLFSLRNKNPLSHPGTKSSPAQAISKHEYESHKNEVGECIRYIFNYF